MPGCVGAAHHPSCDDGLRSARRTQAKRWLRGASRRRHRIQALPARGEQGTGTSNAERATVPSDSAGKPQRVTIGSASGHRPVHAIASFRQQPRLIAPAVAACKPFGCASMRSTPHCAPLRAPLRLEVADLAPCQAVPPSSASGNHHRSWRCSTERTVRQQRTGDVPDKAWLQCRSLSDQAVNLRCLKRQRLSHDVLTGHAVPITFCSGRVSDPFRASRPPASPGTA